MKRIDGGWWLIIAGLVILYLSSAILIISTKTSVDGYIFVGVLSGITYSLTNANDSRAVKGRKPFGEHPIFTSQDFLAVGGFLGVIIVWCILPPIYKGLAITQNYPGNLSGDIVLAFNLNYSIFGIAIPKIFIFVGFLTLISSYEALKIFRKITLDRYALLLTFIMIANIISGVLFFNEKILGAELIVLTILIGLIPIIFRLKPQSAIQYLDDENGNETSLLLNMLLFLISTFLRDLLVRGALLPWDGSHQQFFISLCFRAVYFSVLIVWSLIWLLFKKGIKVKLSALFFLPFVSALTVNLAFILGTPVIAYSLSKGPLAIQIGNILSLSIIGALYSTDGKSISLKGRLAEVYINENAAGLNRYRYLLIFILFAITILSWLFIEAN